MRTPFAGRTVLLVGLICWLIMPLSACDEHREPPLCTSCGFEPPPPVTPEDLILDLAMIYNDQVRAAAERLQLYTDLFPPAAHDSLPGFVFNFQPVDIPPDGEPSWGLEAELLTHQHIFQAQENREIFTLELHIDHSPANAVEYPESGQEGWQEILATNVNLRLMFNPEDGLLVDGGQASFLFSRADDRWYINEWTDLARPFAPGDSRAVEPSTWGSVEASYR